VTYASKETSTYSGTPVECFKFIRAGAEFRYTNADSAQTLSAGIFTPAVISRGRIAQTQERAAGSTEVTMPRNHPFVQQFVPYLPTHPITLTIHRFHTGDGEVYVAFNGEVASSRFSGSECIMLCTPLSYRMNKRVPGTTYQSKCNHALYSPLCTVNKNSFKLSGTVLAISGATVQVAAFGTQPDQWLRNGWLERDADADRRFIIDHNDDIVTLDAPYFDLALGTPMTAYAGCDRTETECTVKFSNLVNHLGFARVPTRNPYDGISEWTTGTTLKSVPTGPTFRRG
jgi:uncharacterized phage protein (TIGR02218 family)